MIFILIDSVPPEEQSKEKTSGKSQLLTLAKKTNFNFIFFVGWANHSVCLLSFDLFVWWRDGVEVAYSSLC